MLNIVLISTYELGRQPFGLASPAAWLRQHGFQVTCVDTAVGSLPPAALVQADLIAFYVPMHTATRLAISSLATIQAKNPNTHLCFYGLYAAMNADYLRRLGVHTLLSGEFETGLLDLCQGLDPQKQENFSAQVSLERQNFITPDRQGLPELSQYAQLFGLNGEQKIVGYTEASRGCKHHCRHCPVVPVYNGRFRIVQRDVVLADIRQQVAQGAEHITFGDPDFFNGIGHAMPLVEAMHREFPQLTYDVTIKIEHLLQYAQELPRLKETGCVIVTSAVESIDEAVLEIFEKGHTREEFIQVVQHFQELELTLNPTFVPFHPWTTLESYAELLSLLEALGLSAQVSPVQLAIRLLIPEGSKLLEVETVQQQIEGFNEEELAYPWHHADVRVDALHQEVLECVAVGNRNNATRQDIFHAVCACVEQYVEKPILSAMFPLIPPRATVPYLNEPWYC